MDIVLDFFKSDIFFLVLVGAVIILLLLYISNMVKLSKLRKSYISFMKKLGNGSDLEEMLKGYISQVENIKSENEQIKQYCTKLDNDIAKCIHKIGMVRYNAFRDTGSDLSFALALLNEHNSGVVLNGIYARDTSNIYAKPVENGKSSYTLSEEEKEAINRAING